MREPPLGSRPWSVADTIAGEITQAERIRSLTMYRLL
jgi:hypothetical protein